VAACSDDFAIPACTFLIVLRGVWTDTDASLIAKMCKALDAIMCKNSENRERSGIYIKFHKVTLWSLCFKFSVIFYHFGSSSSRRQNLYLFFVV